MLVRSVREDSTVARYKFHKNVSNFCFSGESTTKSNPTEYTKRISFSMDGRIYYLILNKQEQENLKSLLNVKEGL